MRNYILFVLILLSASTTAQCSLQFANVFGDCMGDSSGVASVSVTASGPYTVTWSNGDVGLSADSLVKDSTYTVQLTDSAGCVTTDTLFMFGNVYYFNNTVTNVSCFGCCDGTDSITPPLQFAHVPCPIQYCITYWPFPQYQSSPVFTGLCAGTYTVTASYCNCAGTFIFSVGNPVTSGVSLSSEKEAFNYLVSNGNFSVSCNEEKFLIEIFDLSGKRIVSTGKKIIDLAGNEGGIYFFVFTSEEKRVTGKFFKE